MTPQSLQVDRWYGLVEVFWASTAQDVARSRPVQHTRFLQSPLAAAGPGAAGAAAA